MTNLTPLQQILHAFRTAAVTEREKGTYFEELICLYLRNEPTYADLYSDVWMLADVPPEFGISPKDTGIDLVARTRGTGEFHAIQCKFHAEDYRIQKSDIDSFFTASGQKPFTHRIIVTTTNDWTENAENSLIGQQPPVSRIDLYHLENSQVDWSKYKPKAAAKLKAKYKGPKPHQQQAIESVKRGLMVADRGKLIMACGTGKTYTALKLAEELAGRNKRVLFLVPSLALLSQTLTEWTQQSTTPLHSFAVCSDAEVGKKRDADDDSVQTFAHELQYPATTDAARLPYEVSKRHDADHMSVVYSTYHSIASIHKAQSKHGMAPFDLIVCDEAHRTTGATFDNEDESEFVRVHDAEYIHGAKRIYMTATPRVYGNAAKAKAEQESIAICSMDDEALYGKQLHVITFSEAVELDLLADYKVIVLTIDEDHISARLQELLKDDNNQLKVDDAARIVGCWKALSKQGIASELGDKNPMRKAVAFCQVIEPTTGKKKHKVSSKQISEMFQSVIDAYQESADDRSSQLKCEASHIDGTMNATEKETQINWLKAETPPNVCRVLSNVRCLSEGVDVPALDAVLFLSPRSSQVEVVQSVGRVMRKAPGKKLGYVILPVVIPHGMQPHEALNDNKVYKVVWEVLQALRSHDDRFDAFVNKLDLLGSSQNRMEVIAVTDTLASKSKPTDKKSKGKGEHLLATDEGIKKGTAEVQRRFQFEVGELEKALYAKLVKKCGNRMFWDEWASDIGKIAQTHIGRIQAILQNPKNVSEIAAFQSFANELRDDLNDSITDDEVVEMLAQHLITKPVFDALFSGYSFASQNPVSQGMQNVLDLLNEHHLDKEADTLTTFYNSIRRRAEGIDNAEGKQKIVVELYDKFFRNAFPKMTERLGIVYTPVEVVDFIIHSINDILQSEFGQTLGSKGVHIIDPFTGTGTFITRLLQSGLIKPEELPHKYKHEIHANEIVLLAYYIAAINIEAVYHSLLKDKSAPYQPFEGICLTDTFQMYEKEDLLSALMVDNSARRKRQKKLDIRVIMGNPPYSVGQTNANDNNQNVAYPHLDSRINETYAAKSEAVLSKGLYDSYIRAIRWASDRIGKSGIIGFVTNASFLEVGTTDGVRKCLEEEFSGIHIIHLRGNQRTAGELSRKEGGKIFGSGSRAPIAISFLVKNPDAPKHGHIQLHDIGDYLSREDKLQRLQAFASIMGVGHVGEWQTIKPNSNGDWLKQRDDSFGKFIVLGDKKGDGPKVFDGFSLGVVTNRDAWCYNASKTAVTTNMTRMIGFYNSEVDRFHTAHPGLDKKAREAKVDGFINNDPANIKWTRGLKQEFAKDRKFAFNPDCLTSSLYRPFNKQWLYFNRQFNEMVLQMPKFFPGSDSKNVVLGFPSSESRSGFSVFITDHVANLSAVDMVGSQYFPLYLYENVTEDVEDPQRSLFSKAIAKNSDSYARDGISDSGLAHFQAAYPAKGECDTITREDLFYYIYGLLHSPEYRSRYADNLGKELPRIPAVKQFADFRAFSQAGRDLAHWHLNYETVAPYAGDALDTGEAPVKGFTAADYRVTKMKFAKTRDPETNKSINDKTTVIYNDRITVRDIPLEAYEYVVNGKPAIEWVMERQAVSTDKDSGIVNDANLWATETMNDPRYPLDLLLRVITVSLETQKIVNNLPKLDID